MAYQVDSIINAWTGDRTGQKVFFQKYFSVATTQATWQSTWELPGIPNAGSSTAVGKANGRTLLGGSSGTPTPGAMTFKAAPAGKTNYLTYFGFASVGASAAGTLYLVDRICDVQLAGDEASGNLTGMDATSRLATGEGAMLWAYCLSSGSGQANSFTVNYTNQKAVNNRTSGSIGIAASTLRIADSNGNFGMGWVGLASGDTGVRSIQSITHGTSGTAASTWNLCMMRVLASMSCSGTSSWQERDMVLERPNLVKIYDTSCLSFVWQPSSTSATPTILGEIRMVAL